MASLRRLSSGLVLALFGFSALVGPSLPTSVAQNTCLFTDVCDTTDNAYAAIKNLKERGIVKGNPDGSFKPEAVVNRAEMLTMLFRAAPQDVRYDKAAGFPDVASSAWYAAYVSTAKRQGFVQGYPDGSFRPGDQVKTEEAAKMALAFQKTPLPTYAKGYNDAPSNNALPYGISTTEWYTPYLKTVHDFYLLPTMGLAEGLSRRDAAILLDQTQKATATIKAPLKYLTAWEAPNGTILGDGQISMFFYFSKPVDLESAKQLINVTGNNGRKMTSVQWAAHAWAFDREKLGLENYGFRPHELKLTVSGVQDRESLNVSIKAGLKDIYGTALDKDVSIAYKTAKNPMSIALGGPSYMQTGGKQEATLNLETFGDAQLERVTGYLCPVSTDTMVRQGRMDSRWTEGENSAQAEFEHLELNTQLEPQDALKPFCSDIKTANLTNVSKNNETGTFNIPTAFNTTLTPGIYFLGVYSHGTREVMGNARAMAHKLVYISDTVLTLKYTQTSPMHGFVWATDMAGNGARANQPLKIFAVTEESGKDNVWREVAKGTTDKEGILRFTLPEAMPYGDALLAVTDKAGTFGMVGSTWDRGIEPYNYGLSMSYTGEKGAVKNNRIYVHTDRKIYRPGHEVGIRGVVREKTTEGYVLPKNVALTAAVYDSQFKLVTSFAASTNEQGTFQGGLTLPATAAVGEYYISLSDATPAQDFTWEEPIQATFQVEEYRRPEFRVTLAEGKKDYLSGEPLMFQGKAEYYFGLPVDKGHYTWELSRDSLYFQGLENEWFSFYDGSYCYYYCDGASGVMASGSDRLNEDGTMNIDAFFDLGDTSTGGLYTLSVETFDQNERVVRAEQTFRVHKANAYVGVQTNNYMVKAGEQMSFKVVTLNQAGAILPNKKVSLELVREEWTNYAKGDVSGDTMSYNDKTETSVATLEATTGADGRTTVNFPGQQTPGQYFVRATVLDEKGNKNTAREYSYVYGASEDYMSWAQEDRYKVSLLLDKPEYKPGEEAQLVIQSPYPEATALISMERGSVLDTIKVDLTSNSTPIKIPVKASYVPNVYISVVLMPKGGEPGLKLGYGTMMVDTAEKELGIKLSTDKQTYGPGDQVTVDIATTAKNGQPVSAEVSLAVVDESIIALAGGIDRDIMRAFYSMESLSLWTAHSLTHYVEQGLLRAVGGSGKGGPSGLPVLRGLLKDTAYWNPRVLTDASGKARVTFTLPDNLTRWELLAIGVTKDTQVGSASAEIDTRQDLIVQPILPRFVREGDNVTLTYTVFNLTDKTQNVQISLASADIALPKNMFAESIAPKGSKTVSWNATVPMDVDAIALEVAAIGSTASDRFISRLPVQERDSFDVVSKGGFSTAREVTASVALPANTAIQRDRSTLAVQVSAGLLGTLTPSLSYLVQYPYGCAEQTTSVLMGNVLLADFMTKSSVTLPGVDKNALNANVTAALSRLYTYQSQSGGFALWGGEEGVDPYLSAYVLEGMHLAMQQGYAVDTDRMKKLRSYLADALAKGKITDKSTRASAAAILRETGTTGLDGTADTLFKDRANMTWRAKASLVRFYALGVTTIDKERTATLLSEMRSALKRDGSMSYVTEASPSDYMFYYDAIGANAAVLEAFAVAAPDDAAIPSLTAYLLSARQGGMWSSTHENALILRGLNKTVKASDTAAKEITVKAGGQETKLNFAQGALSPIQEVRIPLSDMSGNSFPVTLTSNGGTIYYDASVSYVRTEAGQQVSTTNYQIYRTVMDGNGLPVKQVKLGDKVQIKLELRSTGGAPSGRHIAIEDFLPAGLELLNPNIRTEGGQMHTLEGWINHYELRDDRGFFYLDTARNTVLTVEARAIAPGTFTYPAARASEMYRPGKYTRTAPTTVTVVR